MKKYLILMPLLMVLFWTNGQATFAEKLDRNDRIDDVREFIDGSISDINSNLSKAKKDSSLKDIEFIIDSYYSKNKISDDLLKNEDITIKDIYPSKNLKLDDKESTLNTETTINLEKVLLEAKKTGNPDENFYKFENENSITEVYVSKTGGIILLERSSMPTKNIISNSSSVISPLAVMAQNKVSRTEKTTGILYSGIGTKMLTVWAEGSFLYNGDTVSVNTKDGAVKKHFSGSLLHLDKQAEGKSRVVKVNFNKYAEVYTRVYFEAIIGFEWAGVTIKSGTLEAYVGGAPSGSVYGGLKNL